MYCSNCGQKINKDDKFCPGCEKRIKNMKVNNVGKLQKKDKLEQVNKEQEEQKISKKNKRKGITNIERKSIFISYFVVFFLIILLEHLVREEPASFSFMVGETLVPYLIAVVISLIFKSSIIGMAVVGFILLNGSLYLAFRDIREFSVSISSMFTVIISLSVVGGGIGLYFLTKKVLSSKKNKKDK